MQKFLLIKRVKKHFQLINFNDTKKKWIGDKDFVKSTGKIKLSFFLAPQ